MAFADPQTVTIDGTAATLPRVFEKENVGTFNGTDDSVELEVRPTITNAGRIHQVVQLRVSKNATDPLSGVSKRVSSTISIVTDRPLVGYTDSEVLNALLGLVSWGSASTNANFKKLVAGEN